MKIKDHFSFRETKATLANLAARAAQNRAKRALEEIICDPDTAIDCFLALWQPAAECPAALLCYLLAIASLTKQLKL